VSEQREGSRVTANVLRFTGMGWSIAIAVIVGVVLGDWLDGKAGTHPLFLSLGILLGLASSMLIVVRLLMDFIRESGSE
jgi:ATP synthase protein I